MFTMQAEFSIGEGGNRDVELNKPRLLDLWRTSALTRETHLTFEGLKPIDGRFSQRKAAR